MLKKVVNEILKPIKEARSPLKKTLWPSFFYRRNTVISLAHNAEIYF